MLCLQYFHNTFTNLKVACCESDEVLLNLV